MKDNYYSGYSKSKKYKLCRSKKFIAIATAISTLIGAGSILHLRLKNHKINSNQEYVIGYDNVWRWNSITNQVTDKNFVLLDIGDHNSMGDFSLENNLEYCMEKGIQLGLIVNSNSLKLSDIYLDLEYVMEIMEKYRVSYPVYFCVDQIMDCEELTLEVAKDLIQAFLQKAEANHIYVGACGRQENMDLLNVFFSYDCFVVNGNVKVGNIYKKNGIYYDGVGVSSIIEENGYNDPDCFLEDEYYVWKKGDSLKKVASSYGISVTDLRNYQDQSLKEMKVGDVLRIPSLNHNFNHYLNSNGESVKVGIDVSLWQGQIAWSEVDVDYAIIQIRDFANTEKDPQFEANVLGCLENGIPMGFYAFSRATTKQEVQKEAEYVVSQLQGVSPIYPVYLDLETEFWHSIDENGCLVRNNYNAEETKTFVLEFLQTWEREILKAGYIPGIYCNYALLEKLNLVTDHYLDNMQCWIAGGEYYDREVSYREDKQIPVIHLEENEMIAMKQISSMGRMSGIDGYVDLNYCYTDYETTYDWERMQFLEGRDFVIYGYGIAVVAIGGGLSILKNKCKKRKMKSKSRKY